MNVDWKEEELASDLGSLLENAVEEVRRIDALSEEERARTLLPFTTYQYKIPASNYRLFPTSKRGYASILKAASLWYENSPGAKLAMPVREIYDHALHSFGDMISGDALAHYSPESEIKDVFKGILNSRVEGASAELAHYFPCQIFSEPCNSFNVGPVSFLSRMDWLKSVEERAGRPLLWVRIVKWREEARVPLPVSVEELREQAGAEFDGVTSDDIHDAQHALEAIGRAHLVAAVAVDRRAQSRSDECARLAATVAIDSMMLVLGHRFFQEVRAPLENISPVLLRRLRQPAFGDIPQGWTLNMPGILGGAHRQDQIINLTHSLRTRSGAAIAAFLWAQEAEASNRLKLHWFEGMHWMGDAWRSKSDPVALVKIGIALDILTQGGEDFGIRRLACALLKRTENEPLGGGCSIKVMTDAIYKKGRSQIGHGKRLALPDEIPVDLGMAIQFGKDIFLQYIMELDGYDGPDEFKSYVTYLGARA